MFNNKRSHLSPTLQRKQARQRFIGTVFLLCAAPFISSSKPYEDTNQNDYIEYASVGQVAAQWLKEFRAYKDKPRNFILSRLNPGVTHFQVTLDGSGGVGLQGEFCIRAEFGPRRPPKPMGNPLFSNAPLIKEHGQKGRRLTVSVVPSCNTAEAMRTRPQLIMKAADNLYRGLRRH